MNKLGSIFPQDVIESWPEVFGEIRPHVLPLQYLLSIYVYFNNGTPWEIKITKEDVSNGWFAFEKTFAEFYEQYKASINHIDFRLNTDKIKSDIEQNTNRFLKKRLK